MTSTLRGLRQSATTALLSTAFACSGRTQTVPPSPASKSTTPAPAQATPTAPATDPEWIAVDSANRTVTLTLEVTSRPDAPSALINGTRSGEAGIIVPVGWTAKWNWRNGDTKASHSLVVMVQREKVPLEGGRPAFSNAATRMVTEGLAPGQVDQTSFVAEEAGWYWLMCGLAGHALAGEWIELRVDPEAAVPSVKLKSGSGEE
jgi:uncharacterized lipoprotein YbaY